MKSAIANRLLDLNRQFYQTFGGEFSSTRQRLQPGVQLILGRLHGDELILDLGCGNGEVAHQLALRDHRGEYVGLDFSSSILEDARRASEQFPAKFLQTDLTSPNWDMNLNTIHWSLITAFAFLHHIPGAELRMSILRKNHNLLKPDGLFIHSNWQFLNSKKLKMRIQPWQTVGLSSEDVDPGDFLLDWRAGGRGLRYVHHFDEAELGTLALDSGFRVVETFLSDGEGGRLGLYQIWEKL